MNKSHIPAFTLIEVVVSLAITAIIMSIVFVIFTITSERLLDFKKQNEGINDLNRLSYIMQKAMAESEDIMIDDENGILFTYYNGKIFKLQIKENNIIGTDRQFTDTFKIVVSKIVYDTLANTKKNNIYKRLKCETIINNKEIPLAFYKKIYPDQLLKQSAD